MHYRPTLWFLLLIAWLAVMVRRAPNLARHPGWLAVTLIGWTLILVMALWPRFAAWRSCQAFRGRK
jgi:hypothetical protein